MGELFLRPGELYFGRPTGCLTTVLGSCVAVTFWHPRERLVGMCHFVLPACNGHGDLSDLRKLGRYADGALTWLLARMQIENTVARDYRVGLFGGGCMFPSPLCEKGADIGSRNVRAAETLLLTHGLNIDERATTGYTYRCIRLDADSGLITLNESSVLDDPAMSAMA